MLESQPGWTVCGDAGNGREAVAMAKRLSPDVAVIDITMPKLNGLEAARQIRREMPSVEILILTMHHSDALIAGALEAGARGCIRQVRSPTLPLESTLKGRLFTSHKRGYDW